MNETKKAWTKEAKKKIPLLITSTTVLTIGTIRGFAGRGSELSNFLCITLLCICACYDAGKSTRGRLGHMPDTSTKTAMTAWIILAGCGFIMLSPHLSYLPVARAMALFCAAVATVLRFHGPNVALKHVLPYACCLMVLPFFAHVSLALGYPMRQIATVITAELWRLFDPALHYARTVIRVEGLDVAITDACSGIEQLEAMLLLAYLVVRKNTCPYVYSVLHFCSIFTAIIIANVMRLIVTLALYRLAGPGILEPWPHTLLGWGQVVAAILIFIATGTLLPSNKETAPGGDGEPAGSPHAQKTKEDMP